jgi:hypothetical protein
MDSNCQFRDASQPPTAWAPSFGGERRLLETVDRPQLGRSLETADYLARNWKFESIPLQQGVSEPSVPCGRTSKAMPSRSGPSIGGLGD